MASLFMEVQLVEIDLTKTDRFSAKLLQHSIWKRLSSIIHTKFRLFPVRSSLLRESHMISVPGLMRYFSSPSFLPDVKSGSLPMTVVGLSHSEISGSKLLCSSPERIARIVRPSSEFDVKASVLCS